MATLIPSDTRAAIGSDAGKCDSRSLLLDRFADPGAKGDGRRSLFANVRARNADVVKSLPWGRFIRETLNARGAAIVFAQSQSRLMVNMAGGVLENAGLCLDRFGMPYIPGSAVKGCARRAALAGLREMCGGEAEHGGDGRRTTDIASARLAEIARVFGWCEQDWSEGEKDRLLVSDFAWACGGDFTEIWAVACARLREAFGWSISDKNIERPWKELPNFAGSVSFMPAYPVDLGKVGVVDGFELRVPRTGELELDVVTCHHRRYYQGDPEYSRPDHLAPDTEEPIPVVFPAVAPGHVFAFAVLPLRNSNAALMDLAAGWLKEGIAVYGIGAKTGAGYGWFDASQGVQSAVSAAVEQQEEARRKEFERKVDEAAAREVRAREDERRRNEKAREQELERLPPDQRAMARVAALTPEQFFPGHVEKIVNPRADLTDDDRRAIVEALRGGRSAVWVKIRDLAENGKKKDKDRWGRVAQAIREVSNRMKMGKMP
jgi:CRISPR-associated protein Cmr6